MTHLLFSIIIMLAVGAMVPDHAHSQSQRENVAETGADASEDGAKARAKRWRKAKRAWSKAPESSGVSAETRRQIDQLLLRDAIPNLRRR